MSENYCVAYCEKCDKETGHTYSGSLSKGFCENCSTETKEYPIRIISYGDKD